jgi:peptide-methionine (R)-S-oxide reductase
MNTTTRIALGLAAFGVALVALYAPRNAAVAPEDVAAATAERIGTLRPDDAELRRRLTPEQYRVTQRQYTEPAFDNPFHSATDDGIYVDVVSGEPLFSSKDKVNLGTGWPVFTRPLEPDNVYTRVTKLVGIERTELRSVGADSHLGHLLADPADPNALRYRVNSAALRFIPADSLLRSGYASYRSTFFEDVTDSDVDADESAASTPGARVSG